MKVLITSVNSKLTGPFLKKVRIDPIGKVKLTV